MRSKEDAQDYRYFPDPDLPPLVIAPEWVERVRATMPELPGAMAARFERDDGLSAYDASMMVQSLAFARYYEAARDACKQPKLVANWLMGEVSAALNELVVDIDRMPVSPRLLAKLITRIQRGDLSHKAARQLFSEWLLTAGTATGSASGAWSVAGPTDAELDVLIASRGLKQMNDAGALEKIVDDVLAANAKSVDEYRAGKDKAFNALVGQVMKASKGQANPAQASELLKKKLGAG